MLSGVRVYLRHLALMTDDAPDVVSTAFCVLRPGAEVDASYLHRWVGSNRFISALLPLQRGNSPPAVLDADIRAQPIPMPPTIDHQRRIIRRIDTLFAEIADGERALAEAREGVETYRKSLLKAAVTGELTADWRRANPPAETGHDLLRRILADRRASWDADPKNRGKRYAEPAGPDTDGLPDLPDGWCWARAGQVVVEATYGTSVKCTREPTGIPVLRMGNIQEGRLDVSDLKFAPHEAKAPILAPGDVLFNRTNSAELLGKTAVYDGELDVCSFASYIVSVRLDGIQPDFFAAWMNSIYGRAWVSANKSQQVGQANLSAGKLLNMPLPIAPRTEQAAAVKQLNASLNAIDAQTGSDVELARGSASLRQSILAAAFRGDLVA